MEKEKEGKVGKQKVSQGQQGPKDGTNDWISSSLERIFE